MAGVIVEAVLAIADQQRPDGLVFSIEALRQLAHKYPNRFSYNEETKKLSTKMVSQADPQLIPFVELALGAFGLDGKQSPLPNG